MEFRHRFKAAVVATAFASFAAGCSDDPPYKIPPILAGVVRLDARVVDPAGNPLGTRPMTTADGVRVWLLDGGRRVDSTFTLRGAYSFAVNRGHVYRTLAGVPPAVSDTLPAIVPRTDMATYVDTLRIERSGNLAGAPIPFSSQVALEFSLAADSQAELAILDLSLARVRLLLLRTLPAGTHRVLWDGLDDAGHAVPDGVYWAVMTLPSESRAELLIREH